MHQNERRLLNKIRYYARGPRGTGPFYAVDWHGRFYNDSDTGDLADKVRKDWPEDFAEDGKAKGEA